ncbi:MAG: DAK2 domain-containing protein [Candidatus Enteromonas sp.]|nr:DAK2 domain-containing protein [Candidatus Enteromonas sp.]
MRTITATILKQMYISGANNLYNHYPEVDQLNVFPVPDGDTGMNMNLTATSGAKEIQNREFSTVGELASCFSRGLLMGARGNSGVISSQIFRGFAQALKDKKSINVMELAAAFVKAKEVAYKAVMKPVEGTILTVIRESSDALSEFVTPSTSIEDAMGYLLSQARVSLEHTPDLLPVLKEVGVVDSGGAGLVYILEGMEMAARGKVVARKELSEPLKESASPYAGAKLSEDEEGYGYCTQFIIRLGTKEEGKKAFREGTFKKYLTDHGKSVVLVRDEEIVKVHVHTLTPGNMLNYAQQFGEFVTIVIENMSEEHKNIEHGMIAYDSNNSLNRDKGERQEPPTEEAEDNGPLNDFALVAVSSGPGLDELFTELGVSVLVSGGQTMNPSTEDFVKAIKKAHAKNVFILPNNSNIVLSATQACDVYEDSEVSARVVPSKTIPQGMTAAMQVNPDLAPSEIYEDMKLALKNVKSGSVTYAIKDTDIEGVHVTKDYYMAMEDKKIVSCVKDKVQALKDILEHLIDDSCSSLTVIVGKDVTQEEEQQVASFVESQYGDKVEAMVHRGDQPVYSFLIGVE